MVGVKAVAFTDFGGPGVLGTVEVPDPAPAAGEVLVRVRAATVNPTDTMRRSGAIGEVRTVPGPYVVGMEFAGVVESLGPGAQTSLQVGDRAMGLLLPSGPRGAYSELVCASTESVVRCPDGISLQEAATVPMNGLTALASLQALKLAPGQTVAVTGAAGMYGGYVVQLAKAAGLHVVADASPGDHELVRQLGADVIVERGPLVSARIRAAVPGGVAALVDGAVLDGEVADAVRDGGAIVTVRHFSGSTERGLSWIPIRVRHYLDRHDLLTRLQQATEHGYLTPRLAAALPASQAPEAHRRMQAGGLRGRIVLTFDTGVGPG